MGEFHSIASNEDGSVVVVGGDIYGDAPAWPIAYSNDGMNTFRLATIQDIGEVLPEAKGKIRNVSGDGDGKYKALCYHKKSKTFIAARQQVRYTNDDGKLVNIMCVWTSKTGEEWKCHVLDTFVQPDIAYIYSITSTWFYMHTTSKIAYDDSTGVAIVPSNNSFYWTTDCVTWNKHVISTSEEKLDPSGDNTKIYVTKLGSVDVLEPGRFVAWTEFYETKYRLGTIKEQIGCIDMTYDPSREGDPFVCTSDDLVHVPDTVTANVGSYFAPQSVVVGGMSYCSFFGNGQASTLGIMKYDPTAKAITIFAYPESVGTIETRGIVTSDDVAYYLTRAGSTYKIMKLEGDSLVPLTITGYSGKIEGGCVVGDTVYLCGRSGAEGLLFLFDISSSTMTKLEYNTSKEIATLLKKSQFEKIEELDTSTDSLTAVIGKLNSVITSLKS